MSLTEEQQQENMEKVRQAMRMAEKTRQGGELTEGEKIDFESLEGNIYKGYIVFKKPNMGAMMKMGAKKAELLKKAGVTDLKLVDEGVMFMAHVMATLEVVCVKRPDWFMDLEAIEEPELLYHVFGRYQTWENSFRKDLRGKPADDSTDGVGEKAVDSSEVRVQRDSAN